jgi:putative ABC transport system permease protein
MQYFKLGLRNIQRNARRSLVTVLAIAFGFASINLFSGYIHNVYAGLGAQAVRGERLGHLTIMKQGAKKNAKLDPEKYLFSSADIARAKKVLAPMPNIALTTLKLGASGLISNGKVSTIFIGEGLVAQDAVTLRGDFRPGRDGQLSPDKPAEGLLASELGDMLKLKRGDYATLLVSTLSGQSNALDMDVGNTFNTGSAGTNDKFVLLPLALTQKLLATDGADRIVLLLRDDADLEAMKTVVGAALAQAGLAVEIYSWKDLSDFYNQVRKLFDMIFAFIFAIVLTVVLMSIVNTMTMSIVERTREIGTLRAIGMKRKQIALLFSVEGMELVAIGGVAGILLTLLVGLVVNSIGFSYIPPSSSSPVKLLIDFVPVVMTLSFVFLTTVATLAAFIPARRATRVKVVDALGHV